jgi:7-cyano-7-deazaguanine synthase
MELLMKKLVLLSGGLDSSVCLAMLARSIIAEPLALFVEWGQPNLRHEREAVRKAVERHGVPLDVITVDGRLAQEGGDGVSSHYVPGRNLILVALGFSRAESLGADEVIVGFNRDDIAGFPDCRPDWMLAASLCSQRGQARMIGLRAPLSSLKKREVAQMAYSLKVPLEETWSCYRDEDKPCGACGACELRARAVAP